MVARSFIFIYIIVKLTSELVPSTIELGSLSTQQVQVGASRNVDSEMTRIVRILVIDCICSLRCIIGR